jgi:hypothetical protein
MSDIVKDIFSLQPEVMLMIFGMCLIALGVLGAVPMLHQAIVIEKTAKTIAVTLGIACLISGTWLYSNTKFNSVLNSVIGATPPAVLPPPAVNSINKVMPAYEGLEGHKAMAVSGGGHLGDSAQQATAEYAKLKAWAFCTGFAQGGDPCWVVMVDEKKVGNW